jgi:outer membrane protein insertion porin family
MILCISAWSASSAITSPRRLFRLRQLCVLFLPALALVFCCVSAVRADLLVGPTSFTVTTPSDNAPAGDVIHDVRVEGTQRIEPATVLSYVQLKAGDTFDQTRIDESLKALFATGLFADVTLQRTGNDLVVNVVENPIINRISFEGNHKIDTDKLQDEIQLRPRVVYTRTRVQADVDRILEIYRRSGRYSARVEPKVILLDENRVDLVFEIDEGPRTPVARVNFVGNKEFDSQDLREVIQTKESAWYRFLSSNDTYDPDRLNYDKELLRRFYLAHGYADFRVVSAVAELTPTRDEFFLTITIDEGVRYKFGTVKIDPKLKGLDAAPLYDAVTTVEGDWYNATAVDDSIVALTNAVNQLNYPFVDVKPLVDKKHDERVVNLTYQIDEGKRNFVEKIDIVGNERTVDKVIRRELTVAEGDPYNETRIKQSEQKIKDLGFFEKAQIQSTPGTEPDKTDLKVNVTEQPSGDVSLGAGYSTVDGPLVDFRVRERNFLGEGKDVSFSTTVSSLEQDFNLGYTEPYFLDRDMDAGVDLFKINRNLTDQDSYTQEQTGGNLRLGYPLTDSLRQRLNYRLEENSITDIQPGTSLFIQDQAGERLTSAVGQELSYDKRDSKVDPTKGYILSLDNEVAGLGGDAKYLRSIVTATGYVPLTDDIVASSLLEGGDIVGYGGQGVNIADRFFLGGDTFPGFRVAGIGPRDDATQDALGGNEYYRGTTEVAFPVGLPPEYGIKAHAFAYYGTLTRIDQSGPGIDDSSAIRVSSGLGLSWKSPFGPIRVDLAYPVVRQTYDKSQFFRFSFGTKF